MLVESDKQIWFDAVKKPSFMGPSFTWPDNATAKNAFNARWTGLLEPKFSEDYTFLLYGRNGQAKLWIGGQLVAQTAAGIQTQSGDWKVASPQIPLRAGVKYSVRIERNGPKDGAFHLNWESSTQPIRHVPVSALYEPTGTALPVVALTVSTPRLLRPRENEQPTKADWILTRTTSLDAPLEVEIIWSGTAKASTDYEKLPEKIRFEAGQSEIRIPLKALPVADSSATVELVGQLRLNASYLLDGSDGKTRLLLSDPDVKRVEGVTVTGQTGRVVDWMAPSINNSMLKNLTNGSGLDRSVDPPLHDTDIKNAWYGVAIDADKTMLTFDLGALYQLSDLRVWNLNTTEGPTQPWGQGDIVRPATPRIQIFTAQSEEGPWADLGVTSLRRPSGKAPDPGQLISIGKTARYVRFQFSKPTELTIGLAEVEFYGKAK